MATPFPDDDDDKDPPASPAADPADEPDDDEGQGDEPDEDEGQGDEPDDDSGGGRGGGRTVSMPQAVNQGAGVMLGILLWGWVVLPFFRNGPTEVKRVWKAKFLNKAPDGSALP
jgi:hypothetical protein